jgi:hypothetical protein
MPAKPRPIRTAGRVTPPALPYVSRCSNAENRAARARPQAGLPDTGELHPARDAAQETCTNARRISHHQAYLANGRSVGRSPLFQDLRHAGWHAAGTLALNCPAPGRRIQGA